MPETECIELAAGPYGRGVASHDPGPIGPGLVIEEAGRRSLRFQQSLRRHRQEIDKFPAPPKKARVSYPLAAFATRKPAPFFVPLVSEKNPTRQ
jgi:hypothetical protein